MLRVLTQSMKNMSDTLGNLTLTKYNQEMSNDLYSDKIKFYKKSNIALTRDIANYKDWNGNKIVYCTSEITTKILQIS